MTKRFVTGTLLAFLTTTALSADGRTARTGGGATRPMWTFAGIGAGFGTGLWAGLAAFDDSVNSDRKVWTSAIVGAAAGGILGYLLDRHRSKSLPPPKPGSPQLISPRDERELIAVAGRLGDGHLRRWLDAGSPGTAVSSIP